VDRDRLEAGGLREVAAALQAERPIRKRPKIGSAARAPVSPSGRPSSKPTQTAATISGV
jgi:hypothetical protein